MHADAAALIYHQCHFDEFFKQTDISISYNVTHMPCTSQPESCA